MQCGRPLSIPDDSHDRHLPSETDDCNIEDKLITSQPSDLPSKMSLCVHTIGLYKPLREMLRVLYRPKSVSTDRFSQPDFLEDTMKAVGLLDSWVESLPSHLSLNTPSTDDRFSRQRNILAGRHFNVRLLLGKPGLLSFMPTTRNKFPDSQFSGLLEATALNMALISVNNAQKLIALMSNADRELLGLPWNNMYYCYNAASVLLAAKCCPIVVDQCDNLDSLDTSLKDALTMFGGYTNICKGAPERVLSTLQFLNERFQSGYFNCR